MKSALFLIALLFIGLQAFSQKAKNWSSDSVKSSVGIAHQDTTHLPDSSTIYAIILTGPELVSIFQFIANGDIYSDKGKANFLEALKQKIHIIPKK